MNRVLVPVDLSDVSTNALHYAMRCFPEAKIHCLHVATGSFQTNQPIHIQHQTGMVAARQENFESFVNKASVDVPETGAVEPIFEVGDVMHQIRKYVTDWNPDAIVMGMRDKTDLFDRLFGTITLGVVKTITLPIFCIPGQQHYRGFHRVVVASSQNHPPEFLKKVMDWNERYNAFLSFVHVQDRKSNGHANSSQGIIDTLTFGEDPPYGFEVHVEHKTDIAETIIQHASNINADLIIAAPSHQSFLQTLIFKSISKDLILKARFPILFL